MMNVIVIGMAGKGYREGWFEDPVDERLARRIAVGKINLKQWVLADRRFRTLILE